eukprot:6692520-Prymnesium_polylepis.2
MSIRSGSTGALADASRAGPPPLPSGRPRYSAETRARRQSAATPRDTGLRPKASVCRSTWSST